MSQKNFQLLLLGLALLTGLFVGFIDSRAGQAQIAIFFVFLFAFAFGFLKPGGAWRWALLLGVGVPLVNLFAGNFSFSSLLAFAPAFLGAYGGSLTQKVFNLFEKPEEKELLPVSNFWKKELTFNKLAILGFLFIFPPLIFWASILLAAWLKTIFIFEFIFKNFNSLTLILINIALPFIAMIFGIAGLQQIKKHNQRGRWLTLATIFVAIAQIITLMLWVANQ